MTFQAYSLLRDLRKAQTSEDNSVCIYLSALSVESGPFAYPKRTVDLSRYEGRLRSILTYLCEEGYLSCPPPRSPENFYSPSIVHPGWHITQDRTRKFLAFLGRSVLVPIIVAIITSIVTSIIAVRLSVG